MTLRLMSEATWGRRALLSGVVDGMTNETVGTRGCLDFLSSEIAWTYAQQPCLCVATGAWARQVFAKFPAGRKFSRGPSLFFLPVGMWIRILLTLYYYLLYDASVMSDVFTSRSEQGREKAASGKSTSQEPPRILIDVPMGTSYLEIQETIFRQVYELAGTQLRAAIALGITPDTVSRVLRRHDRKRIGCPQVPEAWPVVAVTRAFVPSSYGAIDGENPTPNGTTSAEHAIGSPGALTPSADGSREGGPATTPGDHQELKTDD